MGDLDDDDRAAERAGYDVGLRGGEPDENPHRRGGSVGDVLWNPRHRRLWERGRLDGEARRAREDLMRAMARAQEQGGDPWEASARWHAADAMIHELVHRIGGASAAWSPEDTAELARLQAIREGSGGAVVSTYREGPKGALISTTPSKEEQELAIARARLLIRLPPGLTAEQVDGFLARNREHLLGAIAERRANRPPPPLPALRRSRRTGWSADKLEAEDYMRRIRSKVLEARGGGGGSGGPGERRETIERLAEERGGFRRSFIGSAGRVVLISCSGPKVAEGFHRPAELYTSPLFRAAVEYATARELPWAVLSAKHGLLLPRTKVEPYEHKLTRQEAPEWAARVIAKMDQLGLLAAGTGALSATWEIHAGALYADPLVQLLEATATRPGAGAGGRQLGGWRAPEATEQPLRGLQIGQRLAWYAARRSA